MQEVAGVVRDQQSGLPIEGVSVYKKERQRDNDITCEKGFFTISSISGGLTIGCPDMTIVLEKEGYKTLEAKIEAGGFERIRLERID